MKKALISAISVSKPTHQVCPQLQLDPDIMSQILYLEFYLPVTVAKLKAIFNTGNILSSHSLLDKKQDFQTKSHQQKRKIQEDLQKRHIFVDQVNIIPEIGRAHV